MRCPSMTPEGGPVISVEVSEKSDALTIVWMSMDTPEVPIDGYLVFLDDQQCGPKVGRTDIEWATAYSSLFRSFHQVTA